MGLILFRDEVTKAVPDYMQVSRHLRSFVNENKESLILFLFRNWKKRQNAIKYSDLRDAIIAGALDKEFLVQWQEEYATLVNENLVPEWEKAFKASQIELASKYKEWEIDLTTPQVEKWFTNHSSKLITQLSEGQYKAVNAMIKRAGVYNVATVDELARTIRPLVGLTGPQATANMNYYDTMIRNGATQKMAQQASLKYAEKQIKQRAEVIAQNELVVGYRHGAYEGVKQAQSQGLVGKLKRKWSSAGDDRVCSICIELDGKTVDLDEPFRIDGRVINPGEGAHISCRCVELFIEV